MYIIAASGPGVYPRCIRRNTREKAASRRNISAGTAFGPRTTGALADSETTGGLKYDGAATYDDGVLTITGDTTVSGTTTSDTIVIKGGTVTLDGVNISNNAAAPISVEGTATITLAEGKTNTLTGGAYAALHVAQNASLTINGGGTLDASATSGAGIGGNAYYNISPLDETSCGSITINGGNINATSESAAGIGAGLTVIGAGLGLGKIGNAALEGTARQPEAANAVRTTMIIIAALLEGAAMLGLVICLLTMVM